MYGNDGGNSRKKELDDFWNIEMITPIRKKANQAPQKSTDTVEITVSSVLEAIADDKAFKSEKLSLEEDGVLKKYVSSENDSQKEPLYSYSLENSLVHNVRIYKKSSNYPYYENFYRDALRYLDVEGEYAERVPYFSYVPQYDQMSPDQLAFYLYFRTLARRSRYIDADYSYILLYIYEILNLGDKMNTALGQSQLCGLWNAYREKYPAFERSLIDWICEYSLINRLAPPESIEVQSVSKECLYKEYLLVNKGVGYDYYADVLLNLSSAYDFRNSKFAEGDNRAFFEKYIPQALSACVARMSSDGVLTNVGFNDSSMSRDAYIGALCSHRARYKIEIDYCSFSRTNELRYLVGDIIKYSENKIRAYLGIKSRLSCYSLDIEMRGVLDNFFDTALVKLRRPAKREQRHEYDALYELPVKPLSVADASKIEEESWETTKNLVEAFEEIFPEAETQIVEKMSEPPFNDIMALPEKKTEEDLLSALGEFAEFAISVYCGDVSAQREFVRRSGRMPDSIVDGINEISADIIGDILIEEDFGVYRIVEDYRYYFEKSEG